MRSAARLRDELARGERSVVELVDETLAAIEALDPRLGAFHTVDADGARRRARELERRETGPGPLFGLPVAVKSNLCVEGWETSCGSRLLRGYRPPYSATAVERLVAGGAVLVGTTHMDEFGMGSSGERSADGRTVNPWDEERVPGGSSSGSAAAVAAGLVPLALGTDTGGSVRQPAALCGVVGFKPGYGRVSRHGLVAFGSSLDQIGALARSAEDAALLASVVSGPDPRDATASRGPGIGNPAVAALEGLRIGVPEELFPPAVEPDVAAAVRAALDRLAEGGARLVPVSLASARFAVAAYYVIATSEASSNLARFDGVRYGRRVAGDGGLEGMMAATREAGFGSEVKRRILLGTYALSSGYHEAWYRRALRVRSRIAAEFAAAFESVDLVAGPTSPVPAFRRGERVDDPLAMYAADVSTVPASLAGLPAVSVPCGLVDGSGGPLPVGLQLVGPRGGDDAVLAAARAHEDARPPLDARPRLHA